MNKILPIILVVVFSGCTNTADLRIKQLNAFKDATAKCKSETNTMVKYVHCIHEYRAWNTKHQYIDNVPWDMSSSQMKVLYFDHEQVRMLEKKYALVIAEEVDAGRATRAKGELEIGKVSKILFDEWNAKRGLAAAYDFQKSLLLLDIYSKAIERTTPKQQIIIPPRY